LGVHVKDARAARVVSVWGDLAGMASVGSAVCGVEIDFASGGQQDLRAANRGGQ
jgi:hypothetical protein